MKRPARLLLNAATALSLLAAIALYWWSDFGHANATVAASLQPYFTDVSGAFLENAVNLAFMLLVVSSLILPARWVCVQLGLAGGSLARGAATRSSPPPLPRK